MKKITKYTFLITMISVTFPITLLAQGGPPATPIDGGLSLLLAAGGAYGIRKIVKSRKK